MGKKEEEKFQKWAKEVAAKLPENLRNSWVAVTENEYDGREEVVNAFLRQDDYTRKTTDVARQTQKLEEARQEVEQRAQELAQWHQGANAEYERLYNQYQALQAKVNGNPNPSPAVATHDAAALEELKQRLQSIDRGAWTMATRLSAIAYQALKDGYSYDPEKIAEFSAKNSVPLETAWQALTADERKQKQDEEIQKRIEAAKEEARREALSKIAPPDVLGQPRPSGPSIVDAIRNNQGITNEHQRRDEALKAFYEAGQTS